MKNMIRSAKNWLQAQKLGEKGIVLPLVLTYVLVFTAEITGLAEYASHTQRLVQSQQNYLKNFYLAEAATEKAVAAIRLHIQTNGSAPDASALSTLSAMPSIAYTGVTYSTAAAATLSGGGAWTTKTLTSGDYAGLNASTQTINVAVTATDSVNGVAHTSTVNQTLEVQLIPLFQFGVFYQNDLEVNPGATMTFAGPVHTNGDLYVGVDSNTASLSFQSSITAYGDILHDRKGPGSLGTGAVNIENDSSVYQNMNVGGATGWLDHSNASWSSMAPTRWDNNVQDASMGTRQLNLPISSAVQSHDLIERRVGGESSSLQQQKMDYKANIRIIDGVVQDQAGNVIELRYCSGGGAYTGSCPSPQTVVNPVAATTYYNFREGKTMSSTDIDVAKLNASPAFAALVAANNGIVVYASDRRHLGSTTYQDSLRLVNGSTLPIKGLTVATENPLYIKGDYNTVSKKPSGIAADSFNILSNSWSDASSTNTGLSGKTASATTVQTAVITGNTETTGSNYNGGFENIHRLHENWSGQNLTFRGSVVVLYNSETATGNWVYGGNYYSAPNRVWSFDTDLTGAGYSIPGFPSVYNVAKVSYEVS